MRINRNHLIGAISLIAFCVVVGFAVILSPPQISDFDYGWLGLAIWAIILLTLVQVIQTMIFAKIEGLAIGWKWALWFTTEKAWLNTLVPAKAGTASAVTLLRIRFDVAWGRYIKFMLYCGAASISASMSGLLLLGFPVWWGAVAALFAHGLVCAFIGRIYALGTQYTFMLAVLAVINLTVLAIGVGTCLLGLGYDVSLNAIAPVGIVMNLLSVAAITPGNFGLRESVLALLSPLLKLPFSQIIQGATCFVFLRLFVNISIAWYLRGGALRDSRVYVSGQKEKKATVQSAKD